MKNMFERAYEVVSQVPAGTVITYGQVARLLGNPRLSRAVGYAMRACPPHVPAHRVVRKDGSLPPGDCFGPGVQRAMLEREGIAFLPDGRVDFVSCRL